jgi:hypothetical protein
MRADTAGTAPPPSEPVSSTFAAYGSLSGFRASPSPPNSTLSGDEPGDRVASGRGDDSPLSAPLHRTLPHPPSPLINFIPQHDFKGSLELQRNKSNFEEPLDKAMFQIPEHTADIKHTNSWRKNPFKLRAPSSSLPSSSAKEVESPDETPCSCSCVPSWQPQAGGEGAGAGGAGDSSRRSSVASFVFRPAIRPPFTKKKLSIPVPQAAAPDYEMILDEEQLQELWHWLVELRKSSFPLKRCEKGLSD